MHTPQEALRCGAGFQHAAARMAAPHLIAPNSQPRAAITLDCREAFLQRFAEENASMKTSLRLFVLLVLAAAATAPAGASQRNYERLGFQVVYTRVTLTK